MPNYTGPADAPRIRGLCVDLDDTLFDHAGATRRSLAELVASEACATDWPLDEVERRHNAILEVLHAEVLAGRTTVDVARIERFRRLLEGFGASDLDRAHRWAGAYRAAYERGWQPVKGALELLAAVRDAGIKVAIVTNNLRREQSAKLARCRLDAYVDVLMTSEEVGIPKPAVRIFQAALDRLGVAAEDALMLGDSWTADIEGGRAAGLRVVWFNPRELPSPDPSVPELRALTPVDDALDRLGVVQELPPISGVDHRLPISGTGI
jgi:HAD superfamily hydrolase (TIGR01549 family)